MHNPDQQVRGAKLRVESPLNLLEFGLVQNKIQKMHNNTLLLQNITLLGDARILKLVNTHSQLGMGERQCRDLKRTFFHLL
jgi:hypothetical protein